MNVTNNWEELGFAYYPTKYNLRCTCKDGEWGELRIQRKKTISLHIAATVLHYSQEAFEGLKAFRGVDGKIRIFRIDDNGKRLQSSCRGIRMPQMPLELFKEAVIQVVKLNERYVPPYGSGASLYIRPVLIGTTPLVGVRPATEYEFIIFATPVGPYFKGGFTTTTPFMISRKYDRAAPLGTGNIKIGGNYAAGLAASEKAHKLGYSSIFFLDPKEKKYIEECTAANFFAIKNNTYITPKSDSVLPSITNSSLAQIAELLGMKVEKRKVAIEELDEFEEVGACGTAAVISPVSRIDDIDENRSYIFSKDGKPGEKSTMLYNYLLGIQYGEQPDTFGWNTILE
jgi:branched-chain amino acid aminotransferase